MKYAERDDKARRQSVLWPRSHPQHGNRNPQPGEGFHAASSLHIFRVPKAKGCLLYYQVSVAASMLLVTPTLEICNSASFGVFGVHSTHPDKLLPRVSIVVPFLG